MGTLKLTSRVAGWRPMAWHRCFSRGEHSGMKAVGSLGRQPCFVAHGWNEVANYQFPSIPCAERFRSHEGGHHPEGRRSDPGLDILFRGRSCLSRAVAAQASTARRSDLTASSFTSSASSMASSSVEPEDVLQFWFRDLDPQNNVYASKNWFFSDSDFDKEIEAKFGECLRLAADGALDGWKDTARGSLALVIVLDQFSRNIHRKSPLAYANDEKARQITLEMIAHGQDKQLEPMERNFLYLPLMHSENLEDHDVAATVYKGLAAEYSGNQHIHERILDTLSFEEKHRAVLEKFGRYPSRNQELGRQSTPEELEYLSNWKGW